MKISNNSLATSFDVYYHILHKLFKDDWEKMTTSSNTGYVQDYVNYLLNQTAKPLLDDLIKTFGFNETYIELDNSPFIVKIHCKNNKNKPITTIHVEEVEEYIKDKSGFDNIKFKYDITGHSIYTINDKRFRDLYWNIANNKIKELDNMRKPKNVPQDLWDNTMKDVRNDL